MKMKPRLKATLIKLFSKLLKAYKHIADRLFLFPVYEKQGKELFLQRENMSIYSHINIFI